MMNPVQGFPRAEPGREEFSFRKIWPVVVRDRRLVVGVATAIIGLAALLTWLPRPVFESHATIRIEEEKSSLSLLRELSPLAGGANGQIETEMVVLKSRRLAEAVVDSLALAVQLTEPSRPRQEVLSDVHVPRDAVEGEFRLKLVGDGTYAVVSEGKRPIQNLPSRVAIGEPFRLGSATLTLSPSLRSDPPAQIRLEIVKFRDAVEDFQETLRVQRPDIKAEVVAVRYRSTDPLLAAAVPNVLTNSFISYKSSTSRTESSSTVEFLRQQVASYEGELREAETRLRAFREEARVISPADEAREQITRLVELSAKRDELEAERESLEKLLARAQSEPTQAGEPSPYRQLAAFPSFLANRAIQEVLQALTQLETERSALLVRRTSENLDVQGLDRRIQELEFQLYQIAQSYLRSLNNQMASMEASLARFGDQVEAIPAREVEFVRLMRQQKLLEEIYTLLQTRLKEAEIQEAIEPGDVRILDPALIPVEPVRPRPLINLGLGVLLGLLCGVGTAVVRDALNTKVRTKEDVGIITGGIPVLGVIPRIQPKLTGNGKIDPRRIVARRSNEEMFEERLVTRRDPRSPVSEAYRALRTSITFASIDQSPQVLVVTSAMPGDGKSTSASNLAITLAQQGVRALLVDADLRRGVLHRVLGVHQEPGLTNLLTGRATIDSAVQVVEVGDSGDVLYFLSTGTLPPNPAELLGSRHMRDLMEQLRGRYEMIIFDAPPLNLVTDAAVLGTVADSTIVVTRAGTTEKGALQHAIAQLHHLQASVGGVVINDFNVEGAGYGYYGYGVHEYHNGNGKQAAPV